MLVKKAIISYYLLLFYPKRTIHHKKVHIITIY